MKKININIIILNLMLISSNLFAQIDELRQDIYSDETYRNITATYEIMYQNLIETFPDFIELYDSKPLEVKSIFLKALLVFNDPDIIPRTNQFIESIDNASPEELKYIDPLTEKVNATNILFRVGQYNTVNYVFDLIARDGVENISSTAFHLLDDIMNKVPAREMEAKDLLLTIYSNGSDHHRYFAMYFLTEKYGSEMIERLRTSFVSDLYRPIRSQALEYLILLDKDYLSSLLRTRFIDDPDWTFRTTLVDTLLAYCGLPSDLKSVIDYQPTEPNETARESMGYSIQYFIPPRPTVPTSEMIENLIDYTRDLLDYGWITKQSVYQNYVKTLKAIQDAYRTESLAELCANLDLLISNAEKQRETALITEEAYKFLYYHGNYIIDNVETEFGECP